MFYCGNLCFWGDERSIFSEFMKRAFHWWRCKNKYVTVVKRCMVLLFHDEGNWNRIIHFHMVPYYVENKSEKLLCFTTNKETAFSTCQTTSMEQSIHFLEATRILSGNFIIYEVVSFFSIILAVLDTQPIIFKKHFIDG